jgi:hypothetical protein
MSEDCIDCPEHYEGRAVDNSAWDGNAAMSKCANSDSPASCYNAICAGKKAGDPALQSSHALPHHKAPGDPPNAAGVRNALARLSQTQGLTNAGAARSHLEGHMSSIQSQSNSLIHRDDGLLEVRVRVGEWELRHTGRQTEAFTVRGYAAVFNQLSLDLGGFREQIEATAFDEVLQTNPDVHFAWDHDMRYVAARTKNDTLKLWTDNTGLGMEAQVGNYSWAKDLRVALERGDIDQGSFAFSVADGGDDWEVQDDESVLRTIRNVDGLYDVTVTAQGAYPQTSMAAVRSLMKAHGMVDGALVKEPIPVVGEAEAASQTGAESEDEEFEMWREARKKQAAAQRATLVKLKERMENLK